MYHENKYPAERNSKTKLNISPTATEHMDIVSNLTSLSVPEIIFKKTKLAII